MDDRTLTMPDGRTVGFADWGGSGVAVIEAHGGPGSRFEARAMAEQPEAVAAGLRLIGIDRPGYGRSDPLPGRVIADWTADALAVADELGVDRFAIIGVSTGASYSMAVASMAPERVVAAMAVCGITDMREASVRDEVTADPDGPFAAIWGAPTRDAAIEVALRQWGEDGSRAGIDPDGAPAAPLAPADMAMFADPTWLAGMLADLRHSFTFGVQGYADDRIADGQGWHSFDVSRIRCPVVVLHGGADTIAPVSLARHTASIVPGAVLDVRPELGHFSITPHAIPALLGMLQGVPRKRYVVNDAAVERCRELIDAKQYVVRSRWQDRQPTAADRNRYLDSHTWDEYSAWHLGLVDGPADDTKARYGFVYGDLRRIHRSALIACVYRASEWDHKAIELAAHELLQRLDEQRGRTV